jgi:poly(A) polymerase
MREIWLLQPRFEKRIGASPFRLLDHLRYRAGYDFLLLRIEAEQADSELGQWWTDFAAAEHEERLVLIKSVARQPGQAAAKKRRRRRGPRQSDGGDGGNGGGSERDHSASS